AVPGGAEEVAMRASFVLTASLALGLAATPSLPAQAPSARNRSAPPAGTAANAAAVSREGIEELETQLDRAVDQVSVPRPAMLLGRAATRGYRLPGYGIVFILSPRALPGDGPELRQRHRVKLRHLPAPGWPTPPPPTPGPSGDEPPELVSLEHQVVVLQQETEEARRAAEEDMDRIVQDVRVRLGPDHFELATPTPAEEPPATPVAPAAPTAAAPPSPAETPLPPAPPWKFWFDAPSAADSRTPEAVIADVREALVTTLEDAGGRVRGLRPEEFVTVAVDFERGGLLAQHQRPTRTLVVRARVRDCEAGARGALAKDELRRRVEVVEY
ncbi:MAG TPA: hypothetical protein VEQ10_06455, partial [Vicinamibacteria bacterium]|nr:hypothetical protein [Vicinamibacteria bacterium]